MTSRAEREKRPASGKTDASTSGFIIGPVRDCVLLIGAPLLGLVIALPLYSMPVEFQITVLGRSHDARHAFILTFIASHLVLVFFRSHGNTRIFRLHPIRFTIVPLGLTVAMAVSPMVMALIGMLAIWWDVYHSSLQTFGFGRIYDARRGNDPNMGRRLDYWLNLLLYAGPVLAGASLLSHLAQGRKIFLRFLDEESALAHVMGVTGPNFLEMHKGYLSVAIAGAGIPFLLFYVYAYYRMGRQGYRVSWQKVWLFAITGAVSIYSWGFHSFIDAFWVMNFFHAWQYFAIVWFVEKRNVTHLFKLDAFAWGRAVGLLWVVVICFAYGFWASFYATSHWMMSLVLTVAIMHFWYDGFIWSVRRRQV